MKKLLHIVATPREDESRTLHLAQAFLSVFQERHPEYSIDELNLTKEPIPDLTTKRLDGKYALLGGKDLSGELKDSWQEILKHIERFMSADLFLISTPMWNYSVPYTLKKYIDIIVQPRYLFRYTKTGVEGLVKNKKMIVLTSRGGEYRSDATKQLDFQEPYLRAIFSLTGITDMTFINAQPMDMGKDLKEKNIQIAIEEAKKVAKNL